MIVPVVAGVIVNSEQQILIAERLLTQDYGGLWELPGGKIEQGETARAALDRELAEELGIEVCSANPWLSVTHTYPEKTVLLDVWWVDHFVGVPVGKQGQRLRWTAGAELNQFTFPAGNVEIIAKLVEWAKGNDRSSVQG